MTLSTRLISPTLRLVVLTLLVGGCLLLVGGADRPAVAAAGTARAGDEEPKVTICHRTNSHTNPYNQIAVAESSVLSAHADHTGPVFTPGADNWGDIIPPIDPGLPNGLNWPEGRDVLENGCEMKPDVGPLPAASIGDVACAGTDGQVEVVVRNGIGATAPASYVIRVEGTVVAEAGPVAPGDTEVVLVDLAAFEDQTVTVEVSSGGEVVDSRVVTVDCVPAPEPSVEIDAQLTCADGAAQGSATVTNHGQQPVVVTAEVAGDPIGSPLTVPGGETRSGTVDLSAYEDQTITVDLYVDGEPVASYEVTPNCVPPVPQPRVSVAGSVCPPPSATVTLANDGDPDSRIVYAIRVDGQVVQRSAPIYGGDVTTIVADLSAYEDQTIFVELSANGEVLGSRSIHVNCEQPEVAPDQGEGDDGLPNRTEHCPR